MKKVLSLVMALAVMLSLVACGSSNAENENGIKTDNSSLITISETFTTEVAEFRITRFEFSDKLKNATFSTGKEPDKQYLLPTDEEQENNPFKAKDGNIMLSFSYSLKNIGKEKLSFPVNLGILINYNDGYKFDAGVSVIKGPYVVFDGNTTELEPLSPECEGRGYVEVPKEVMENEDASLLLVINVPENADSSVCKEVICKLR